MDNNRYRKIGTENAKEFKKDFDALYEKYKKIAADAGYHGTLKLVREREKVLVYIVI